MTKLEAELQLLNMYEKKAKEKNQEIPERYKKEIEVIKLIKTSKSNDSGKDLMYAYYQKGIYTIEKIKSIVEREK